MEKIPITSDGKLKVEEELKSLKTTERPRIINAIAEARAHGDLSENAEYHAAKEEQAHNETRIMELEDLLSKAEVIDPSKLSGEDIKFGAKVILIDLDTDEEAKYQIVGDIESDFKEKKISISSPIAKALIGKSIGDEVEVNTKPKTDLVALAGYRRAISNFVTIVTGESDIKVKFNDGEDSYTLVLKHHGDVSRWRQLCSVDLTIKYARHTRPELQ